MRVRGLKPLAVGRVLGEQLVAPYAGAWIETSQRVTEYLYREVAPYAGAWIETAHNGSPSCLGSVAPYAGAWIET